MSINVWSILKFFAYVAIIMFFLFPIAWIFNMSFMTNDEILRKVSDSAKPKFEIVTGSSNKAEAKIAGITPAVLIFKGK